MKCAVQDLRGNYCPEKPTRQIDEGVWLCNKCYRSFVKEIRFKRKGKVML